MNVLNNNTPDQLFRHNPIVLQSAYDLWKSGRYNQHKKAIFYSADIEEYSQLEEVLKLALNYRFEPNTIQFIGALREDNGLAMRYDEAFLNMLQRLDFQSLKYSKEEKSLNETPIFSVKSSLIVITVLKQILKTWLYDVRVILEN